MPMWMLRLAIALFAALMSLPALADNWTAIQLRGTVVVFVDGNWQRLSRGDVVPDDRLVQTSGNGHVVFSRGAEMIDLGPSTQVQIFDKPGSKPYTTVKQFFGVVKVEAEVQKVQHFSVENNYLAAVVKGTKFTVTADKDQSTVAVQRGHVAVTSNATHAYTTIAARQLAAIGAKLDLSVSGMGKLPPVMSATGELLSAGGLAAVEMTLDQLEGLANDAAAQARTLNTPQANGAAKATANAVNAATKGASNAVNATTHAAGNAVSATTHARADTCSAISDFSGPTLRRVRCRASAAG